MPTASLHTNSSDATSPLSSAKTSARPQTRPFLMEMARIRSSLRHSADCAYRKETRERSKCPILPAKHGPDGSTRRTFNPRSRDRSSGIIGIRTGAKTEWDSQLCGENEKTRDECITRPHLFCFTHGSCRCSSRWFRNGSGSRRSKRRHLGYPSVPSSSQSIPRIMYCFFSPSPSREIVHAS